MSKISKKQEKGIKNSRKTSPVPEKSKSPSKLLSKTGQNREI
jgi:hypothetical protein